MFSVYPTSHLCVALHFLIFYFLILIIFVAEILKIWQNRMLALPGGLAPLLWGILDPRLSIPS